MFDQITGYHSHIGRRQWHPTPVLLPGKSHGQRSLEGCSPWGRWESDTTERLHFDFSLSCIGEGNGNPLQCSCLENPRDGGAWWAAVYRVAQSRTWLKWLSSSSIVTLTQEVNHDRWDPSSLSLDPGWNFFSNATQALWGPTPSIHSNISVVVTTAAHIRSVLCGS